MTDETTPVAEGFYSQVPVPGGHIRVYDEAFVAELLRVFVAHVCSDNDRKYLLKALMADRPLALGTHLDIPESSVSRLERLGLARLTQHVDADLVSRPTKQMELTGIGAAVAVACLRHQRRELAAAQAILGRYDM